MAAGITEDEGPIASRPKLWVKGISVDSLADDLKIADQLTEYLNVLAEIELEASDVEGAEIGKKESRRSVLSQAIHDGLQRRIAVIVKQADGEPLPPAKDAKAMRAYATRVLAKASKRG